MKYLKVFADFAESLTALNDAECGRLFKAMLEYASSGREPDLRGNERFVWPAAKVSIDRDSDTYRRKTEVARNNSKKRYQTISNDINTISNDIVQDKDKDKDKDKDNDKDYSPPISPRLKERFARFWAEYPRKAGKVTAEEAFFKLGPDDELTDRLISAVRSQKLSPQWQEDGGKFIPYPSTWLKHRRWEDGDSEVPPRFAESLVQDFMSEADR